MHQIQAALETSRVTSEALFQTLVAAFQVVLVELDKDENPHQIFESLNTKGQSLGQADLVRNYIAMRLPVAQQEKVFFGIWAPLEQRLSDDRKVGCSGLGELTAFLRHSDAMTFGVLPSEKQIYARFRDDTKSLNDQEFMARLSDLNRLGQLYDGLLRPDKGANKSLRNALNRLNALDISVAYPFLLALSDHYERGKIALEEYVRALEILENYLVRRFVVDEPTHFLNKLFASLSHLVDFENLVPSLKEKLAERKYPSDDRIRQIAPRREFYDKTGVREKTVMIFERINAARYAGTDVKTVLHRAPTLEHVMPQTLSLWWREHLGEGAQSLQNEWLHTLGNLTLVTSSYNASLSNDSFPEKQTKLKTHGLKLNSEYFGELETWDENAIQSRADWLFEQILAIWPSFGEAKSPEKIGRAARTPAPKAITIRGVRTETKYWSHVLCAVGEFFVLEGADFKTLKAQFPHLVSDVPFTNGNNGLSNGWFITSNWDAPSQWKYAQKMLEFHGVAAHEWQVEEEQS